jgi:phosphopantothenoylcysteine decarboxylase/phosphopantothenate--cysteine ligase
MKILVGITGSISVYKTASLVSYLSKSNEVKVMMTKNATQFVTPLTFETLSKQKVITDMFNQEEDSSIVSHIYYAQEYDLIIVAPATANIIGKVANGIADDMLSSTILASNKPIIFVPCMNTIMYENKIFQSNIDKLKQYGMIIVEPDVGTLACGSEGKGKYPKIEKILNEVQKIKEEL